MEGIV